MRKDAQFWRITQDAFLKNLETLVEVFEEFKPSKTKIKIKRRKKK